jgi:hypothetical protein
MGELLQDELAALFLRDEGRAARRDCENIPGPHGHSGLDPQPFCGSVIMDSLNECYWYDASSVAIVRRHNWQ